MTQPTNEQMTMAEAKERIAAARRDRGPSQAIEKKPVASTTKTPATHQTCSTPEAKDVQRRARCLQIKNEANLPERHWRRDREAIQLNGQHEQWGKALQAAIGLIGKGSTIALLGERWRGKTQLAVEACRYAIIKDQRTVRYETARALALRCKESWRPSATTTEYAILSELSTYSLLVIDELQQEGASQYEREWQAGMLTELLDWRYRLCKDTLLITNDRHDQFKATIGLGAYRRIKESGGIIVCNWPTFAPGGGAQ